MGFMQSDLLTVSLNTEQVFPTLSSLSEGSLTCSGLSSAYANLPIPKALLGLPSSGKSPQRDLHLWCFPLCLGFSAPATDRQPCHLALYLDGWAWPSSELVPPPLLLASAHDREGISFGALTGNCSLAPRQLAAGGESSVVSFPSFGM